MAFDGVTVEETPKGVWVLRIASRSWLPTQLGLPGLPKEDTSIHEDIDDLTAHLATERCHHKIRVRLCGTPQELSLCDARRIIKSRQHPAATATQAEPVPPPEPAPPAEPAAQAEPEPSPAAAKKKEGKRTII